MLLKVLEEIENFPNLVKDIKQKIEEAKKIPSRITQSTQKHNQTSKNKNKK